jgi:septal ring factor EnvC (AmiA/AmiB activator)
MFDVPVMAVFSPTVYSSTVYDTGEADNGWLGGTFNDPYRNADSRREERDRLEAQREAEEEVIRLKQQQQALRLEQLAAQQRRDKQTSRQLAAISRRGEELQALVDTQLALIAAMQQQKQQAKQDALLVLMMACPWINLGGETMH